MSVNRPSFDYNTINKTEEKLNMIREWRGKTDGDKRKET